MRENATELNYADESKTALSTTIHGVLFGGSLKVEVTRADFYSKLILFRNRLIEVMIHRPPVALSFLTAVLSGLSACLSFSLPWASKTALLVLSFVVGVDLSSYGARWDLLKIFAVMLVVSFLWIAIMRFYCKRMERVENGLVAVNPLWKILNCGISSLCFSLPAAAWEYTPLPVRPVLVAVFLVGALGLFHVAVLTKKENRIKWVVGAFAFAVASMFFLWRLGEAALLYGAGDAERLFGVVLASALVVLYHVLWFSFFGASLLLTRGHAKREARLDAEPGEKMPVAAWLQDWAVRLFLLLLMLAVLVFVLVTVLFFLFYDAAYLASLLSWFR